MSEEEEFNRQIREQDKEMDRWENSLEGIYDRLKVSRDGYEEDERYKGLICKVLQRLPKGIRNKVLRQVTFDIVGHFYGTYFNVFAFPKPKEKRIELKFIVINFGLMENEKASEDRMMDTIAHEIAHHVLGHYPPNVPPDKEKLADDLSEKWGFRRTYKDYSDQ